MDKREFVITSVWVSLMAVCGLIGVWYASIGYPGICIFFTFAVSSVSLLGFIGYAIITRGERE